MHKARHTAIYTDRDNDQLSVALPEVLDQGDES
jgi:hypothetical protein